MQRAIIHWKCEGLSEADAHRSVLPASPLMTMAGVVSHMRWVEHCWFEVLFLGRPRRGAAVRGRARGRRHDGRRHPARTSSSRSTTRQCAVSNEIVAAHSLDESAGTRTSAPRPANLRWMLIHMVEETARHAGHLDAIRELLDGEKGYY